MVSFSVTFLFRILNFLLLVGLAVYIFYRYFYASFKAHMATRQAALHHLEEQKNILAVEQTNLDHAMQEQTTMYNDLVTKLHQWRACVAKHMIDRKHEQELRRNELFMRMRQRSTFVDQERLKKIVTPHVLRNAQVQLQQFFVVPQHQNAYINAVFKRMQP